MSVHDLSMCILFSAPVAILIAQSYFIYSARQRHDKRLQGAFVRAAELAIVIQEAIISGQPQRASDAATQIEQIAQQCATARPQALGRRASGRTGPA